MQSRSTIVSGTDGFRRTARVDLPVDGAPRASALLAHCLAEAGAAESLSQALTREGIAVLRVDLAAGEGGGAAPRALTAADLLRAADQLEAEVAAPALLVGHSLAGPAVLRAAAQLPTVVAVATLGAPFGWAHAGQLLVGARAAIEATGEAEVELGGRRIRVDAEWLGALREEGLRGVVGRLRRALLVLHAPTDEVVGIGSAAELFGAARHPKSFVSLDGADHLLSGARDARHAGAVLAAWADRYLPPAEEGPVTAPEVGGDHAVAVRTGRHGYRTEVRAGRHGGVVDEPVALGGTDQGPTPYDCLLVALGACTSITLRMYADRKAWPLEEIGVRLRHERLPSGAATPEGGAPPRRDRFVRELELVGALSEAQRARLLEIADRCPVHRTLEAGVEIRTRLG